MNKLEELQEQIAKMTTAIQENYPELSQYLKEMPKDSNQETLSEYYNGLLEKFRAYVTEHQLQNANRKYKDHHL
jgi:hypothetical protein